MYNYNNIHGMDNIILPRLLLISYIILHSHRVT